MSRDIPVEQIRPNPEQPRRHFAGIEELATSLREQGQVTPILVRPVEGGYEIVHGERRWRAATAAGLPTLRAEVRELTDEAAYRLALVENVQRANLNAIEEAEAYSRLLGEPGEPGMTQEQVGALIGKTQSYVAQKIRLLVAPAPLKALVAEGALSEGHARQLLKLERLHLPSAKADMAKPEPLPPGELLGMTEEAYVASTAAWEDADALLVCAYNFFRPEGQPPLGLWMLPWETIKACPALPALRRSFVELLRVAAAYRGRPPQWIVAAWWWASGVVVYRLPVSTLAKALDLWAERYQGALFHLAYFEKPSGAEPEETLTSPLLRDEHLEWWLYWSDARHAGSLAPALALRDVLRGKDTAPQADLEFMTGAVEKITAEGSYPRPSAMQAWGLNPEVKAAAARLDDPVGSAMSRDMPAEPATAGGRG